MFIQSQDSVSPVFVGQQKLTLIIVLMILFLPKAAVAQLERTKWMTSRITGSPDPAPPLETVQKFSNLKFQRPLLIRTDSAQERLWVVEQGGAVYSFPDEPDVVSPDLFIDLGKSYEQLTPNSDAGKFGAAYGLAFHPKYPKVPVCWITYTLEASKSGQHLENGTRLSRFNITFDESGIPRCDVASEEVLLTWLEGGHNGACLEFGPDGYLYISAGDGEVPNPPDPRDAGQDVSNLLSTIMRIDVMPEGHSPLYRVPADNPFVDLRSARPEIWAYGFRNPWKMTFAPGGELWVGDVGWELYEMVYRIRKGGNYGWSIMEGPQPVRPNARRGPTEILPAAIALAHTDAASVTGGYVYQGRRFPELMGSYIFGDFETRRIWSARFDGETLTSLMDLVRPSLRLVAFGEDTSHELLMLNYEAGTIHELVRGAPADVTQSFPVRLSETGLFKDLAGMAPADGVTAFEINAPMWNDGARVSHWLAVPGDQKIEVLKNSTRRGNWMWREQMLFPKDSVLTRTMSLTDDANRDVKVETQLLHFDGIDWKGYSYAWNTDQQDAKLVPAAGLEIDLQSYGDFTNSGTPAWHIQSRSECMRCHNHWVGGPLAFTPPQLNRAIRTSAGSEINQILALRDGGWLDGSIPEDPAHATNPDWSALANSNDASLDLERRARSWLSVNCSHCHQNGAGGTATIDLRHTIDQGEMKIIDVKPNQGLLDLDDAHLVALGKPDSSVLLYRIATIGKGHMPHIGSTTPDPQGVSLVRDWIKSLRTNASVPSDPTNDSVPSQLTSPSQGLRWMLAIHDNAVQAGDRDQLLKAAHQAPPEISNLFERFQPAALRRHVRATIDPAAVLKTNGDAAAGKTLFHSKRLQCATCHKIGSEGGSIGPALDDIGKRQTREEILTSLLEPSKKVDPKYATWVVTATDGNVHSGLLIQRDEKHVVLRNTRGIDITLKHDEIEEIQPQAISIMPEKQLNDLSDQEIAGLLQFLSEQKP